MLSALEETGALDNTMIVFTTDHGDALGDHGLAYKSFFYESMPMSRCSYAAPACPLARVAPRWSARWTWCPSSTAPAASSHRQRCKA